MAADGVKTEHGNTACCLLLCCLWALRIAEWPNHHSLVGRHVECGQVVLQGLQCHRGVLSEALGSLMDSCSPPATAGWGAGRLPGRPNSTCPHWWGLVGTGSRISSSTSSSWLGTSRTSCSPLRTPCKRRRPKLPPRAAPSCCCSGRPLRLALLPVAAWCLAASCSSCSSLVGWWGYCWQLWLGQILHLHIYVKLLRQYPRHYCSRGACSTRAHQRGVGQRGGRRYLHCRGTPSTWQPATSSGTPLLLVAPWLHVAASCTLRDPLLLLAGSCISGCSSC